MSSQTERPKTMTAPEIAARKGGEPIVCLTAYTTPMARRLDPHVDILLVGDSLGMVLYGLPSTLGVTLDMMIAHGAAVVRGRTRALVTVDLPFGSYQTSPADAYRTCVRVLAETGCEAVKLEGGVEMADTVAFLTARGIPVMGHVGLMPQSVQASGGYHVRGRRASDADRIVKDAKAIADAGAFSMVVEGVVEPLARDITAAVAIPTIGIGASAACDGQVLVTDDMLGLSGEFTPRFVKRFADLGGTVDQAVAAYAREVKARTFPGAEHLYVPKPGPKRVVG
ncbi:MAG: 3-methyl-2-oxobutanoate hydroxymethyltransferase [Gemmatimonas sp.]